MIPAFIFFFQKLYPFPWVNRSDCRTAAAAGGCILIRRDALREAGDFPALRDALIDDCTLAARIKQLNANGKIWLGLADAEVISLRDNRALGSVWSMVRRTAFTQLRHSWLLLCGSTIGMALMYLGPVFLIVVGVMSGELAHLFAGALASALMCIAYWPTTALYRLPWPWVLTLPLAAVLYMAMTIASAFAHLRGRGGAWKGRVYD